MVDVIPSATQIGKVYKRLIADILLTDEDYAHAMLRVYNDSICGSMDNYNSSAYYESCYAITHVYNNGRF